MQIRPWKSLCSSECNLDKNALLLKVGSSFLATWTCQLGTIVLTYVIFVEKLLTNSLSQNLFFTKKQISTLSRPVVVAFLHHQLFLGSFYLAIWHKIEATFVMLLGSSPNGHTSATICLKILKDSSKGCLHSLAFSGKVSTWKLDRGDICCQLW